MLATILNIAADSTQKVGIFLRLARDSAGMRTECSDSRREECVTYCLDKLTLENVARNVLDSLHCGGEEITKQEH